MCIVFFFRFFLLNTHTLRRTDVHCKGGIEKRYSENSDLELRKTSNSLDF